MGDEWRFVGRVEPRRNGGWHVQEVVAPGAVAASEGGLGGV